MPEATECTICVGPGTTLPSENTKPKSNEFLMNDQPKERPETMFRQHNARAHTHTHANGISNEHLDRANRSLYNWESRSCLDGAFEGIPNHLPFCCSSEGNDRQRRHSSYYPLRLPLPSP